MKPMAKLLREFAAARRLNMRLDACNELIVPGRCPNTFIAPHSPDRLQVMLLDLTPRRWTNLKKKAIAAGLELFQDGDAEGSLLFDPTDGKQGTMAIRIAQVRAKRILSPEHRQKLSEALLRTRSSAQNRRREAEGTLTPSADSDTRNTRLGGVHDAGPASTIAMEARPLPKGRPEIGREKTSSKSPQSEAA